MAPRTRSNRVEMLARQKLLASGQQFNTSGFAALPDELYLEIISHFPAYPIPCGHKSVNVQAVRDRHVTLFALSQTCRSLRPAFLRYLWQRIEVYDGMETGKGRLISRATGIAPTDKRYAEELVRQLEVVTVREPSLAKHVNFINVLVTEYSVDTVLQELARCMALFPNLHTVQLNFRFNRFKVRIGNPFVTYRYPSIKNAYVCHVAAMILCACPEVRILSPPKWQKSVWWPPAIFDNGLRHCHELEVLGQFLFDKGDMRTIVEKMPKLREISLHASFLRSSLALTSDLSKLHHLRIINIIVRPFFLGRFAPKPTTSATIHEIKEWRQWAKDILSEIPQNSEDGQKEPRKILVHHEGRAPDIYLVE